MNWFQKWFQRKNWQLKKGYIKIKKEVKEMKAKALQNFYSAEHGSVDAGAELNFQNEATMQEMINAGYVEQIEDPISGNEPIQSNLNENPMPVNSLNDTVAQQSAMNAEFASEMGLSAKEMQAMQNAQKQTLNLLVNQCQMHNNLHK
jgi:hypothetical protein